MQSEYGDNFILLEKIKSIYCFSVLEKLLKSQPNVSSAMVGVYETHKSDLQALKKFLRGNAGEEVYRKFFRSAKKKANYVNYIGYTKKGGDKIKVKHCTDVDFYAELKKLILNLEDVNDAQTRDEILQKLNDGVF